jgi:hypothetical protein
VDVARSGVGDAGGECGACAESSVTLPTTERDGAVVSQLWLWLWTLLLLLVPAFATVCRRGCCDVHAAWGWVGWHVLLLLVVSRTVGVGCEVVGVGLVVWTRAGWGYCPSTADVEDERKPSHCSKSAGA